jgi:hypothetical protein
VKGQSADEERGNVMPTKKTKQVSLKGVVKAIDDVNKKLKAAKKSVDPEDRPLLDAKIKELTEIKECVLKACRHLSAIPA